MTVEIIAETGEAASKAGEETIRVPRNLFALVKQSYDGRERVLDWMLCFALIAVVIWAFWEPVKGMLIGGPVDMKPNENVSEALPDIFAQPTPARIYTWNSPFNRSAIRNGKVPTGLVPPTNPSCPPQWS